MKNQKIKVSALVLIMALFAGGCGTQPYTLTDKEQAMIVNYAAHILSKYNQKQPDGLSYVPQSDYQKAVEGDTETETPTAETETPSQPQQQTTDTATSQTEQPVQQSTALTDALGLDGITAEYKGAELKDSYTGADYYSLDATSGNTFLILHITLTNTTDQSVQCDLLSRKPAFTLTVNGSLTVDASATILLNDLETYQDTITAGKSEDTVLLFEIPEGQITSPDQLKLKIEMNGTSSEVDL